MIIQGLQKLTLLDYPGKIACTVFTAGCNFRCPFCHNASLVTHVDMENTIPTADVLAFLKKRQGILDGVCVTGGEPLLQPDLEEFLSIIKEMGYLVKLDTNGSSLRKLQNLVDRQLIDYVAMDIKNSKEKYGDTIGIHSYDLTGIEETVDYLLSDKIPYEFRTTVVREFHNREDFEAIGRWIEGAKRYYIQSFEDSGDVIGVGLHSYKKEILEEALAIVRKYVANAELRGVE